MRPLTVEYRLDPQTQGWTATMPEVPELVTQGKTLGDAHRRVRQALALLREDAQTVELQGRAVWDASVPLSEAALEAVRTETELRIRVLDLEPLLERATAHAVQVLILEENQTYRFAGSVLGITHQRVEQIARAVVAED